MIIAAGWRMIIEAVNGLQTEVVEHRVVPLTGLALHMRRLLAFARFSLFAFRRFVSPRARLSSFLRHSAACLLERPLKSTDNR